MTNPHRALREIDHQLRTLEPGPAALALTEEGIRLCDTHGWVGGQPASHSLVSSSGG